MKNEIEKGRLTPTSGQLAAPKEQFTASSKSSNSGRNQRFYGRFLLLISGLLFGISLYLYFEAKDLSPAQQFQILWDNDSEMLFKGHLGPEWKSINKYNMIFADKEISLWKSQVTPPITTSSQGIYDLDILITSWREDKKLGVLVQYTLKDKETQNLIQEFGRTYVLENQEEHGKN